METLFWVACGVFGWLGFGILQQLTHIKAEMRDVRYELERRLGPLPSIFNRKYENSNIHFMLADIHRVVTSYPLYK